jgi:hypothetical protein
MARNGDIVVVNQQLHIDVVGHGETGRFSIVAFLLGTVGTEAENGFARVCQGHTVDVGPHVTQTTGAELNPGSQAQFGVSGQFSWAARYCINCSAGISPLSTAIKYWVATRCPASSKKVGTYFSHCPGKSHPESSLRGRCRRGRRYDHPRPWRLP